MYCSGPVQKVMDLYPVRLSHHVIRQVLVSEAVASQYIPFPGELEPYDLDCFLTLDSGFFLFSFHIFPYFQIVFYRQHNRLSG